MPDFAKKPHSYREYHDKAYPSHNEKGHGDDHKKKKAKNGTKEKESH
jgi:hypothetical protein